MLLVFQEVVGSLVLHNCFVELDSGIFLASVSKGSIYYDFILTRCVLLHLTALFCTLLVMTMINH